jgi:Raf kinase inhibitor-like YbhB/YbcL family protein
MGALRAYWRRDRPDFSQAETAAKLALSSSSFADGERIPPKYTCDGAGLSPNIQLPSPPPGTKSFLLVMDDTDAWGFVHWLLYNIPPGTYDIPDGASRRNELLSGASEGENSIGNTGYFGPCPPGSNPHHYVFRLYALDTALNLPAGKTKKELTTATKGHILAEGSMTGLYTRGGG